MSKKIYKTRREAMQVVESLLGWVAVPERIDVKVGKAAWVIACRHPGTTGDWQYLHEDGYVR